MALHGTKALEVWCKNITGGYKPEVNIVNMTTSWRSGLGFCAIIHHYCPHLIEWPSLDPDDVYGNNKLAFDLAEQHLGIPSLLDPQDMVECELLDRLSILTYLSQYYQAFHSQSVQARVRKLAGGTLSKSGSANSDLCDAASTSSGSPRKVPTIGRLSDPCRICQKSVYILERLNIGGRIVHRTCFRCGRCGTQLSLAGYYETEKGDYCCELCPDEEQREEQERTSGGGDGKSDKAELENVVKLDTDSMVKTDKDSGHSSDGEDDHEDDLDLGASDDDSRSHLHDANIKIEVTDDQANLISEEAVPSIITKDSESNLCTSQDPENSTNDSDQFILESKEVSDETSKIVEVNNKNELTENDNNFEDIIDENSNNFKSLVIDSNENTKPILQEPAKVKYPEDMNPFGDDEVLESDGEEDQKVLKKDGSDAIVDVKYSETIIDDNNSEVNSLPHDEIKPSSTNPFGSDLSDEDEPGAGAFAEAEATNAQEVAQPSQQKFTSSPIPSVVELAAKDNQKDGRRSLNPFGDGFSSDEDVSVCTTSSPSPSVRGYKGKKKRRAPPPPPGASPRPSPSLGTSSLNNSQSRNVSPGNLSYTSAEQAKRIKDENNLNRRSQILEISRNRDVSSRNSQIQGASEICDAMLTSEVTYSDSTNNLSDSVSIMSTSTQSSNPTTTQGGRMYPSLVEDQQPADKTEEGHWRKKKGPAPPRPIPPRRTVKKLHRKAINQELEDIEIKQSELERQGVKLEKSIRHICDKEDERGENRDSLGPEAEDLIIQLFDLVNEKNELFRRQTELIYMKKDNRLEEQHADLEHQIRVLMSKPDSQKTDEESRKEERLINKLVELVSLRNEIVDCLEMDRLRELEEDIAIEDHMSNYAAVHPTEEINKKSLAAKLLRIKHKKKKKKHKDVDSEKDIDESEMADTQVVSATQSPEPDHENKKKSTKKKKIMKYAKKLNLTH